MQPKPSPPGRTALIITGSVLVLAVVVGLTVGFGLEVRTSYGNGVDSRLGDQVKRDFLVDQQAEAVALSKADESQLNGRLTEGALTDVVQQIHSQSGSTSPPTVSFEPSSITVLKVQDPNDPSLVIKVEEDGVKHVSTNPGPNAAPSEQTIGFHGDFWLRLVSGRYLIADQSITTLPASYLPQIALVATGLLWVGLASVLLRRTRTRAERSAPAISPAPAAVAAESAPPQPAGPPRARTVIRTFGGLHVLEDGQDWAPALSARSVMAFFWMRILIGAIRDRSAGVMRDEISRQASPQYDRETQLKRLRNLIYALRELPVVLRNRILAEPQTLRFDLGDCSVDALELLDLSAESAGRSLLTPAQVARVRTALDASSDPFLPEFEAVEDLATDHHPTCIELVNSVRDQLAAKRIELALVLADTYVADRKPGDAIAVLQPAFRAQPGRQDIAQRLAAAYRAAGRDAEARGLAELNR
jgi:DNA-binding SARP family transcriptional activator